MPRGPENGRFGLWVFLAHEAQCTTAMMQQQIFRYIAIPPIDARMQFEQFTLLFLPEEIEEISRIAETLKRRGMVQGVIGVETLASYARVAEAVQAICEKEKVHNYATVFALMAEYAIKYLESVEAEAETEPMQAK